MVLELGIMNSSTLSGFGRSEKAVTVGLTELNNADKDHPSTEAHHEVITRHPA